jgi:hypothetical protein
MEAKAAAVTAEHELEAAKCLALIQALQQDKIAHEAQLAALRNELTDLKTKFVSTNANAEAQLKTTIHLHSSTLKELVEAQAALDQAKGLGFMVYGLGSGCTRPGKGEQVLSLSVSVCLYVCMYVCIYTYILQAKESKCSVYMYMHVYMRMYICILGKGEQGLERGEALWVSSTNFY